MTTETTETSAAGQWAALWEVYMHENRDLRARLTGAEAALAAARAERAEAVHRAAKAEVDMAEADVYRDSLRALLGEGLEIVESLSAGYDSWEGQVRRALGVS